MANNRELSQLGSLIHVNDSNQSVGIGTSLGIKTNSPGYDLDVNGDINFAGDLYQNGSLFTSGLGVGIATVDPQSGIMTGRIGVGFTDMNFVGTGITVTGYGTTVVVDMSSIAAASAGQGGDDIIRLAIAFG
jgi:hypothetical protein|tara:strand:- start:498 stop:893 length:396 start_codon:yes stop_codon:yes gene_type:complete